MLFFVCFFVPATVSTSFWIQSITACWLTSHENCQIFQHLSLCTLLKATKNEQKAERAVVAAATAAVATNVPPNAQDLLEYHSHNYVTSSKILRLFSSFTKWIIMWSTLKCCCCCSCCFCSSLLLHFFSVSLSWFFKQKKSARGELWFIASI